MKFRRAILRPSFFGDVEGRTGGIRMESFAQMKEAFLLARRTGADV
jgi:hypothetical protein